MAGPRDNVCAGICLRTRGGKDQSNWRDGGLRQVVILLFVLERRGIFRLMWRLQRGGHGSYMLLCV